MNIPILGQPIPDLAQPQQDPTAIDLTKPLTDDDFKRGMLMVLNNIAGELGEIKKITYDATAMRHHQLELFTNVAAQLEAVGILEATPDAAEADTNKTPEV